jgi:hypothetical protein
VGGALGKIYEKAVVKGCSSLAGSFIIDKNGEANEGYFAGGFIGDFKLSGTLENCYSNNQIVMSGSSGWNALSTGGGFAGRIGYNGSNQVSVSYCYALGDVSVTGTHVSAGGFAGGIFPGGSASYCYAAGDVYIYCRVSGSNYAGGFAAYAQDFNNCYALGNVFADKSVGDNNLYAGALVGHVNGNRSVERCFAMGSVTAQRDTAGITGVGGLVGNIDDSFTLTNSVALGASLILTGPDTASQHIGRVVGKTGSAFTLENNYANNGMKLYQDADYGDGSPALVSTPPTLDADDIHGENAHAGIFRNSTFWTNTPGDTPPGLGFSATDWDFSLVALKGHPRLRGPDGTVMGGQ